MRSIAWSGLLLVLFACSASKPQSVDVPANTQVTSEEREPSAGLEPLSASEVARLLRRSSGRGRSPFQTGAEAWAVAPIEYLGLPRLSGVLFGHSRRVAWLDGRPYGEGELINGYRLERIETERVFLTLQNERIELSVSPEVAAAPAVAPEPEDQP